MRLLRAAAIFLLIFVGALGFLLFMSWQLAALGMRHYVGD